MVARSFAEVGQQFPSERRELRDEKTGARLWQMTAAEAMHHHFYFTNPSWPDDQRALYFVSYRNGFPNLFAAAETTGEITQLTARVDINPFSPTVTRDGRRLYFSAQDSVVEVDRETLREHTDRVGVSLYDSCGPGERFLALRAAIRAGTLKCSPRLREAQRLRQQLSMVRPKLAPNGTLSVLLPEAPDGSHCDLADVLARAVWGRQKYGGTLLPREEHVWAPGEEELQRRIERQESEDWWEQ